MIDLYYWPTPNGHKITIFLEETGLPYKIIPLNILEGEQFSPEFLKISPNNKIPAIIDHTPIDGGKPLSVFESGAILLYLADKTRQFIPQDLWRRTEVLQWLIWQVASLGPMAGQNHHFTQYAEETIPYAINRYVKETSRLYAVLDKQLSKNEFIVGNYSITDMACYPWIVPYEKQRQNLDDFPHIKRWFNTMENRPAVKRAYSKRDEINPSNTMSKEAKQILFGQDASSIQSK